MRSMWNSWWKSRTYPKVWSNFGNAERNWTVWKTWIWENNEWKCQGAVNNNKVIQENMEIIENLRNKNWKHGNYSSTHTKGPIDQS